MRLTIHFITFALFLVLHSVISASASAFSLSNVATVVPSRSTSGGDIRNRNRFDNKNEHHQIIFAIPSGGANRMVSEVATKKIVEATTTAAGGGFVAGLITKMSDVIKLPSKTTIVITALTILLVREWWGKVPRWIRRGLGSIFRFGRKTTKTATTGSTTDRDITGIKIHGDTNDLDSDDSIFVLVGKVQRVLKLADEKFENQTKSDNATRHLEGFQQQMALLTTLVLVQQTKERTGNLWDEFRAKSGKPLVFTQDERDYLLRFVNISDWTYLTDTNEITKNLRAINYTLIRNVVPDEPGRVGHYIAIDEKKKIALIAVKGSSSVADFATDACGTPVPYELKDGPYETGGPTSITCHEGILDASLDLLNDIQPLIEHLFIPSGYKVFITGHSLGAGVASIVGTLLRSRIPVLRKKGIAALEVLVFAPPPVLNYEAAKAASSFVTSVVNNLDIIPRTSINNAASLLQFLDIVYGKLGEKGLAPDGPKAAFDLLSKLNENDGTTIMSAQELFDGLTEASDKGDELYNMNHLYVPGKVWYIYTKVGSNASQNDNEKEISKSSTTNLTGSKITKVPPTVPSNSAAIETDGSCDVLQHIDIDKRMVTDHLIDAYLGTLNGNWAL